MKSRLLFKLVRFKALRGPKKASFGSKSKIRVPLTNSLTPLTGAWSKFFFSFSRREGSALASLKTPSLAYLVRTVSLLERVSLLVNATTTFPSVGRGAFLGESLSFLHESKGGSGKSSKPVDGGSFILGYTVEGGYLDLWPRVDLKPFVMAQTSLSPLLSVYSKVVFHEEQTTCF